jgi:hypothetical protein
MNTTYKNSATQSKDQVKEFMGRKDQINEIIAENFQYLHNDINTHV